MGSQYRLLTLFADGGFMMYPLVLCSMISVGVMIAKFFTLHIAHTGTNRVLTDVDELVHSGDIDGEFRISGVSVSGVDGADAVCLDLADALLPVERPVRGTSAEVAGPQLPDELAAVEVVW